MASLDSINAKWSDVRHSQWRMHLSIMFCLMSSRWTISPEGDKPRCLLLWPVLELFRNSVFERGNRRECVRSVVDAIFPLWIRKFYRNLSDDPLAVWRLVNIRFRRHATHEPRKIQSVMRRKVFSSLSSPYFSFQCQRSFEDAFERIDRRCRLCRSVEFCHWCKQLSGITVDLLLGMTVAFIQCFIWNLWQDELLSSDRQSKEHGYLP